MNEYYNGSISQEPAMTNKINEQLNIRQQQEVIYNEHLLSQFNLENLGIDYLKHYNVSITLDLYDKVIAFIDKSYIHINYDTFILEDNFKKQFFGRSIYELFFVDIPAVDIYDIRKFSEANFRNELINLYITKTKRFESLKLLANKNIFTFLIFKNSMAANLFNTDITDLKSKYLDVLISRLD